LARVDEITPMAKVWTILGADRMDESLKAQLQATLDMIPAVTWLAAASGALLFVNSRCADHLGSTVHRQGPETRDRPQLVQWRDLAIGELLDNKGGSCEL
jgi:hypothetical protein